jgi:ABC-type uncharacterized transport system involved in gliding motility auxiliary subunit
MKLDRNEIARFIATIAIAMLIASGIRYYIQGELLTFSKILLIGGGVLMLAAIVVGYKGLLTYFSKRGTKQGSNTLVLSLAVLAIIIVANVIGYRHPKRIDLTTEKLFTLSDQSAQIAKNLKQDVTVVRFDQKPSEQFDNLMKEYSHLSPRIQAKNIDPNQRPEVAHEYGATHLGDVFVASGDKKILTDARGEATEQDITSAIIKATSAKTKTVCFVTGHTEGSITNNAGEGFGQIADGLKKENYATKSINLVADNGVPSDCDVIADIGPQQGFLPQEVAMVGKYLDGGGAALFMINAQTDPKLGDLFGPWNIALGDNVVLDASGNGQNIGLGPAIPLVIDFGDSPITKTFQGSAAFFPLARTVSAADKSKTNPNIVDLLKTTNRSFTVAKLDKTTKSIDFNPATAGPLSLGVSAERRGEPRSTRMVVIGNAAFAQNAYADKLRNGDLFYNSISWLAADENLISIRPKSPTNRSVNLTQAQTAMLKWLDIIFIPGLVIVSGIYIWWKRR